jgi:hypothetical protein
MVCTEADAALLLLLSISYREFAQPEAIRFGETVDAPPRFTSVPKMKGAKQSVAGKPWIQTSTSNNSTNNSTSNSTNDIRSNSSSISNNRSSGSNSTNRSSSTANSNNSSSHNDVSARSKRKAADSSTTISNSTNSSSSNSSGSAAAVLTDEGQYLKTKQMEQVRQETLEAYAALKKRRRNGNTNYIAHAL